MTKIIKDARVHYAVLKIRAVPLLVRCLPALASGSASEWPGLVFRPGLKKRLRSFRTQQRVWLFSWLIDPFPRRQADSTNGQWSSIAPHVNVPPLSKPLRNRRPKRALASLCDADAP
jgi:hypothetical protein